MGTETHCGIIHVMPRCLVKFDISAKLGKYTHIGVRECKQLRVYVLVYCSVQSIKGRQTACKIKFRLAVISITLNLC